MPFHRTIIIRRAAAILLTWLAGLVFTIPFTAAADDAAAAAQFRADCAALAATPHRLTGSPENRRAVAYLAERLRAAGIEQIVEQPFPAVRLVQKECSLELKGQTLPLQPLRPDGLVPPATLPEGISGKLLLAGQGRMEDYGNRSAAGRIVVLDYNCGDAWLRAFSMGAKAVIFTLDDGPADSRQVLYTEANANLPRYFFPGGRNALEEGAPAVIRAAVTWERTLGRNLLAVIPGTAPKLQLGDEEVLVLAAPVDTFGEVPFLTPGARGAANCAALLEIAARLKADPPKRDVAILFLDAQAQGHAGAGAFYRVFQENVRLLELERRRQALDDEKNFLDAALVALDNLADRERNPDVNTVVFRRLKLKADEHAMELNSEMEEIRRARIEGLRRLRDGKKPELDPVALQASLDRLQTVKNAWNDLRRALANNRDARLLADLLNGKPAAAGAVPGVRDCLDLVVGEVRGDVRDRLAEWNDLDAGLRADLDIYRLLGHKWLSLHLSLLLGDTTPAWGLMVGGNSFLHSPSDQAGLYGKIQKTFKESAAAVSASRFSVETVDGAVSPQLFVAAPLVHGGEVAGLLGVYNAVLGTVQERLPYEGTPADTLANLNLERVEAQAAEIARLLRVAASDDGLSLRRAVVPVKSYFLPEWVLEGNGKILGPTVSGRTPGSSMPNKRMAGALVQVFPNPANRYEFNRNKLPGFCNWQTSMSDGNAGFGFGPLATDGSNLRGFTIKFDGRGLPDFVSDVKSLTTLKWRQNLFPAQLRSRLEGRPPLRVFAGAMALPPVYEADESKVLNARSNGVLETDKSFVLPYDGLVYWYTDQRVEAVKVFGMQSVVGFAIGPTDDASAAGEKHAKRHKAMFGDGFSQMKEWWAFPPSAQQSATDFWRLNETRLKMMRERGIVNGSIEELHGRAEDLMKAAHAAASTSVREAYAAAAFLSEFPVYRNVRSSLDDLVRAVLILLGLAIPFAFALERLLVGSTNIYRQILWFSAFFAATFLILFFVHPAFAVSNQPVIIFLAFALIVLSSLVIFVIMQKFETELKVLQGLTSTVHSADVSRFGTMMAAMSMGISTMRRRPLRTALTALTIILLTFTILNFASFDTRTGVVTLYEGAVPNYTGVVVHKVNWTALNPGLPAVVKGRWGAAGHTIVSRYWLPAGTDAKAESQGPLLSLPDGAQPFVLQGVVGIEPAEVTARPDFQKLLGVPAAGVEGRVFITKPLAARLGIGPGAEVRLGGLPLKVGGVIESVEMEKVKDMDGNTLLPVDFNAMKSGSSSSGTTPQMSAEDLLNAAQTKTDWVKLPNDSVAIVSAETARRLGASLRLLSIYTPDAGQAMQIAEDLSRMLPVPVVATRDDGVYTHVLAPTLMAKGVKDLLFPILLGGMVIFGTMLGSVADREKEIYTFSALGLAPAHVATLFFAEALVYAFIGGLGGYLLAQGLLKFLGALAAIGWLKAIPEMNYSSVNAIVTILIVMGTVLVSAIYPAFKASRSANPGVLRAWRAPAPEGDSFKMVFPFTVSQYDITGVISFLKEHFDNYSDTSLGCFMAKGSYITRNGDSLGLASVVALAPFDLGVTQEFRLYSIASEIPGIDEVKIEILRKSGQRKDWVRLNKVLLDDLRRQFLIWRSLPAETMELYRSRTLTLLGAAAGDEAVNSPDAAASGGAAPAPAPG